MGAGLGASCLYGLIARTDAGTIMSIYFDQHSKEYALNFNELTFWSSHFGQLLLDNIPLKEKIDVLDVGCATGFPLLELADRLGKDSRLTGIDPWPAAVDYLNAKIGFRGNTNAKVLLGDARKIPFVNDHFDLIVSNLGLNNFENREMVVRECHRVLSADGRLAVTTNYKGHMLEFYDAFRESLNTLKLTDHINNVTRDENRRSTIAEIRSLFTAEGFTPTNQIEKTFCMRHASGTAFLESSFIESCFMPTWRSLVPESARSEVFGAIENELNALSKREGELRMSIPMAYLEFKK